MTVAEFLASEAFDDLLQAYRYSGAWNPQGEREAVDAIKAAILRIVKENAPSSPSGDST